MGDIISYVYEFGDFTFAEKPFCEVDGLIFSHFSYFLFDDIIPGIDAKKPPVKLCDAAQRMDWHNFISVGWETEKNRELFYKVSFSRRYRDTKANYFASEMSDEEGVQFCAVTFMLGNGDAFVSFRGTDDAIVGWKEDFYMAYKTPVGAQLKSTAYLNRVAGLLSRGRRLKLYLGGHSKGGNLAVYAAMTCDANVKRRLVRIYDMDGPGFRPDFMETLDYDGISDKILKIVPSESFVGLLMERKADCEFIKSTDIGIQQHICFSWCIEGDRFERTAELLPGRKELYERINSWILDIETERVGDFIDSFFKILEITGARTLTDLKNVKGGELAGKIRTIMHEYSGMEDGTKQVFREMCRFMLEVLAYDKKERIAHWDKIGRIRQKIEEKIER